MRKVYFLLMLSVLITACGSDSSDSEMNGDVHENTIDSTDSNSTNTAIMEEDTSGNYVPPPPPVDEESIKRKEKSALSDEDCCADLEKIKKCCCDIILKKYEEYLKKEQYDEAMNLPTVDPHYPACERQHDYFGKKIKEIQDRIFGE